MRARLAIPAPLLLMLAGCMGVTPGAPALPTPAPLADTVVVGYPTTLPTFDPHVTVAQTGAFAFQGIFDQLLRFDASGALVPSLATAWRQLDERTVEFTLREGVRFHTGEGFDARVAQWNIERVLNPETRSIFRSTLATIAQVEAPTPTLLRVRATEPDPLLLRRLLIVRMIPPRYLAEVGAPAFGAGRPSGTGPYRVREYFPNERVVLEAFDSWRGRPKTPTVVLQFNPDRTPLAAGLRTGEVDAVFNLTIDQVVQFKGMGFTVTEGVFPGAWYLELNTIATPPFREKRVRQALTYAIDRETIANRLFQGFVKPAAQMVSPAGFGYDPDLKPWPYDPAKARQLLAEAGYPGGGFKVKASLTAGGRPFVEAVAGMWKEVGVELELELLDLSVFTERFNSGPVGDVWVARSFDGDVRDADAAYQNVGTVAQRPEARSTWRNEQFATLYARQRRETDPQRRLALLREMIRLVYEEAPVLPVYYQDLTWVVSPKVRGFQPYPDTSIEVATISKLR
ncbi:MAG: ABC transporter substrate-binding protein [Dehalococcoidia bacterium]|nr:MAG: ABC transporter substrate-binding protein [Dehalococcoidia bacterium]